MKARVININEKDIFSFLISPAASISFIIALAEVVKMLGVQTRFIPVFDLLFGLFFGVFIYTREMGISLAKGIVLGLTLGLSACGLFSGAKNLFA